jgi:hypothetical protein
MKCNIIGSGNSLRDFNLNTLDGYNICINYTYKHVKRVDMTVFFDNMKEFIAEAPNPQYLVHFGGQWHNEGFALPDKPMTVANINASFAMALAVAVQKGFTDIHCYGIDNRIEKYLHWYSHHKPTNHEKEIYGRLFDKLDNKLSAWVKPIKERGINVYMYDSNIKHFENRELR